MMAIGAPHLSREFYKFTRMLGEARSKEEEERIVLAEIASLKHSFLNADVEKDRLKEYLVRAVYVEMLGFEAPFAHIHAINMAQEKSLACKMAGYFACRQLLKPQSELMLLLINTIQKDLHSPNYMEVTCALQCICDLVNGEMLPIILPRVVQCLENDNEYVRKHAIMAIRRFHEFDNSCVSNLTQIIERGICDSNPAVMGCTLSLLQDALAVKPRGYRNLVPSLVSILNQIVDHRLPKTYNYHKVPAPWMQIAIISIFGKMGQGSKAPSTQICECIRNVLQHVESMPFTSSLISNAIVSECVKTISIISANESLTKMCSISVTRMLTSENNNMRYAGIAGLSILVGVNVSYAAENQMAVVACLEDRDETIRRCTLDLLYRMTNSKNVVTIVKCFLDQLRSKSENYRSLELINKVSLLCEKFAPNATWYLDTVLDLMMLTPDLLKDEFFINTVNVLKENADDASFRGDVLCKMEELQKRADMLPDIVVRLISWVYAYYPTYSENSEAPSVDIGVYLERLLQFLKTHHKHSNTTCWILSSMRRLIIAKKYDVPGEVLSVISHLESSNCTNVAQCCKEIRGLCDMKPELELQLDENDCSLAFLENYVTQCVMEGRKPYEKPVVEAPPEIEEKLTHTVSELRFEPYVMETAMMETYKETVAMDDQWTQEIVVKDVPRSWGPSGYIGKDDIDEIKEATADADDRTSVEPSIDMSILSRGGRAPKKSDSDSYVWKKVEKKPIKNEHVEMARALFQGLNLSEQNDDGE